jgi:hypothetical protein
MPHTVPYHLVLLLVFLYRLVPSVSGMNMRPNQSCIRKKFKKILYFITYKLFCELIISTFSSSVFSFSIFSSFHFCSTLSSFYVSQQDREIYKLWQLFSPSCLQISIEFYFFVKKSAFNLKMVRASSKILSMSFFNRCTCIEFQSL